MHKTLHLFCSECYRNQVRDDRRCALLMLQNAEVSVLSDELLLPCY